MNEREFELVKGTLEKAVQEQKETEEFHYDLNDRIDKYWKHKESGEIVEVQKYLKVEATGERIVVYKNPSWGYHLRMSRKKFQQEYDSIGN